MLITPGVRLVLAALSLGLLLVSLAHSSRPSGLYSDAEIRRMANYDLDRPPPGSIPCLDVVPDGEHRPRREVFGALDLSERRIGHVRGGEAFNHVTFLRWRLSPSYDLSCMTYPQVGRSWNDPLLNIYGYPASQV